MILVKGAVGNGFLVCPPNSYIKVPIDAKFLKSFFVIEMYFKDLTPGYFDNKGLFSIETDVGQTYSNLRAHINTINYLELNHGFISGEDHLGRAACFPGHDRRIDLTDRGLLCTKAATDPWLDHTYFGSRNVQCPSNDPSHMEWDLC